MRNSPPAWVDPLMRVGYTARGIVYLLIGALAFTAAVGGGPTPDSKSAVATLLDMPLGTVVLGLIALGLIAYCSWTFIDGALDLDDKGGGAKGWAGRAALFISGAVHLTLAFSVASLALGRSDNGGGDRVEHWTAVLMQQPLGRWLVAVVGAIAIAIGVQHFVKAHTEKYKQRMRYTQTAQQLNPLLKFGLVAHGVVVVLVGAFFLWASWTADPTRAGGMRDALLTVRSTDAGQLAFAVMGVGLIGFAVYCFIEAAFRIVPRCAPQGLETLASKARALQARL